MRKQRQRALRRAFISLYDRPPSGMQVVEGIETPGLVAYRPSEWRRLKSAFKEARRAQRT